MHALWNLLFRRQPPRQFARLDAHGVCLAFKQCEQPPAAAGWVEISEIRLHWINRPLPASARVQPHTRCNRVGRAVAA